MLKIRTARKEDATAIINININSWRETYKGIFPDIFLNSLNENIEESINKCKNNISEYIQLQLLIIGQLVFAESGKIKKVILVIMQKYMHYISMKIIRAKKLGPVQLNIAFRY